MTESEAGSSSSRSGKGLFLSDRGLKSVAAHVEDGSKQKNERIVETLRKICLLDFMRRVYKWQDTDICHEFVRNWNHKEKKTRVNDVEIDVSIKTFETVTGLKVEENAEVFEDANQGNQFPDYRVLQRVQEGKDKNRSICLSEFQEPWLRN
ncbi:hypothetical protein R1flu_000166 [Riccia fluitans]|uniref:Uncharacterized protein n=1 Tax=Riccia fluitans TaxID=41844 RepID=A0ABD1XZP0_9MARC